MQLKAVKEKLSAAKAKASEATKSLKSHLVMSSADLKKKKAEIKVPPPSPTYQTLVASVEPLDMSVVKGVPRDIRKK